MNDYQINAKIYIYIIYDLRMKVDFKIAIPEMGIGKGGICGDIK